MAVLTPRQRAARRRIEQGIRLVAPALDLLLFAGHHVSKVAGRNDLDPEPARRLSGSSAARARIERSVRESAAPGDD